ncbi:unnamed protein product [Onchocerca flexuosa]|uniref:EGF-like domain-containing protein n=1 Tax=Onchocerca flexuosa TaxID=387005 RepID=A0A183H0B3_9BILA|nr:unnamed protein product [Onchocerca flexuosa]
MLEYCCLPHCTMQAMSFTAYAEKREEVTKGHGMYGCLACLFLLDAPGQQQSIVNTHFGPSIIVLLLSSSSLWRLLVQSLNFWWGFKEPGCTLLASFVSNLCLIARHWLSPQPMENFGHCKSCSKGEHNCTNYGTRSGHQCQCQGIYLSNLFQRIFCYHLPPSPLNQVSIFFPDLVEESARRLGLRLNLSIFKWDGSGYRPRLAEERDSLDRIVAALKAIIVVLCICVCLFYVLLVVCFVIELNCWAIERGTLKARLDDNGFCSGNAVILLNKPIHGEEQPKQRVRKSRYRHARVRYHSPPTSESDSNSRSSSSQHDDSGSFVLESSFQRRKRRLAHARRFGIDPPSQTVDAEKSQLAVICVVKAFLPSR